MAKGLTMEKTGDLVSIWGHANVQNELDAVARVVSSAREVPRGSPSIPKDSVSPMYATVDMQSTAEEKQQAAPRISHYGNFVRGTCMAERVFTWY